MKTEHAADRAREWTNVDVEELLDKGGSIAVKDAHNAALASATGRHNEVCYDYAKKLAAKRERREVAENVAAATQVELDGADQVIANYKVWLADAKRRHRESERKLAVAQAAIVAHNDGLHHANKKAYEIKIGGTAALDAAVDAARNPLVNALRLALKHINPMAPASVEEKIDAALAKAQSYPLPDGRTK